MESEELPRETSMCEMSTTNEYQGEKTVGLLLPHVSRSHNIMRDGTESEWVTTFSNCHESTASSSSHSDADAVLPGRIRFELALATPIDARSAAAGDVISAQLITPILRSKSSSILAPAGSTVTGRIVRLEHHFVPMQYFCCRWRSTRCKWMAWFSGSTPNRTAWEVSRRRPDRARTGRWAPSSS